MSNVRDREGFLRTLRTTLGFVPKVPPPLPSVHPSVLTGHVSSIPPYELVQSQPSSRKWLCSLMAPTCMQVEFNAGVVAAGEARIESTVVGNTPAARARSARDALRNQTQVYLPVINSADR